MPPSPRLQRTRFTLRRSPLRWTAAAAALFVVSAPSARAQVACKLLQPAEVEAALKEWAAGGKATPFTGATETSGGTVFDICRSDIVRPGRGNLQIVVNVVKNLPMSGDDAIRTRNAATAREKQWKVAGARFEEKMVGKAICTFAGRPGGHASSVCAIPNPKGYVEVEVIAPTQKETPPMDTVGALVQKANSRL